MLSTRCPVRLIRRRVEVRWGPRRSRSSRRAGWWPTTTARLHRDEALVLDHYLEILLRKPGALTARPPLAQARASVRSAPPTRPTGNRPAASWATGPAPGHCRGPAAARNLADAVGDGRHGRGPAMGTVAPEVVAVEARRTTPASTPPLWSPSAPPSTGPRRPGPLRRAATGGRSVSGLTEQAAEAAIGAACRVCTCPPCATRAARMAEPAAKPNLHPPGLSGRSALGRGRRPRGRRRPARMVEARFPRHKRLDDFDCAAEPEHQPGHRGRPGRRGFIDTGDPVCLLGDRAPARATCSSAPASPPVRPGGRVRYVTAPRWSTS